MRKYNRLTGAEIRSIHSPKRLAGDFFTLAFSLADTSGAQYACVVSKKVYVRATDRNTLKRRMRAVLRDAVLAALPGSYVFSAKSRAREASFKDIQRDLTALLERARSAR